MINEEQRKFAINFILYTFCFIFISFIGINKSLAYTYTNIGELRDITQQLVSTNYGNAPFENPVNSGYAFNEVLEVSYIISNYSFSANVNYQLESHLTNQQLTNANYYSVTGYNGEACLISYQNSIFQDAYPRWAFQCPHSTNTITISIRNSSNEYLWSGTGIFTWTTALLKSSDTSLGSDGVNNSDAIINNQNQNTQSIINNQNQNTQDIINNQNQNTQDMIDSQMACDFIDKSNIKYDNLSMYSNGFEASWNATGITNYIKIDSSTKIKVLQVYNNSGAYSCFYNSNKEVISCIADGSMTINSYLTIPDNSAYVRFTIHKANNQPQLHICKNGNQAVTDSLNDLNDTLTDDSSINIDSLGDTAGWLPPGPIDSIINLPLNFLNNLLTALNGTCQPLNIPLPYLNKTLPIPCISTIFNQINGLPNFWNWVGVISSIVILYRYLINLYKYYDDLTTMKANFISDFGGAP